MICCLTFKLDSPTAPSQDELNACATACANFQEMLIGNHSHAYAATPVWDTGLNKAVIQLHVSDDDLKLASFVPLNVKSEGREFEVIGCGPQPQRPFDESHLEVLRPKLETMHKSLFDASRYSNRLVAVGGGYWTNQGFTDYSRPVVRVYVRPEWYRGFPRKWDDNDIDVQLADPKVCALPQKVPGDLYDRYPRPCTSNIIQMGDIAANGSVGCFVWVNGESYFVTAGHVLTTANLGVGDSVKSNHHPIGTVSEVTFDGPLPKSKLTYEPTIARQYDFGLVRIAETMTVDHDKIADDEDFAEWGHEVVENAHEQTTLPPLAYLGVMKYGFSTKLTFGTMDPLPLYFGPDLPCFIVRGWSGYYKPFGEPGDSGSCVFDTQGKIVGILVQYWMYLKFNVVFPMERIMRNRTAQFEFVPPAVEEGGID